MLTFLPRTCCNLIGTFGQLVLGQQVCFFLKPTKASLNCQDMREDCQFHLLRNITSPKSDMLRRLGRLQILQMNMYLFLSMLGRNLPVVEFNLVLFIRFIYLFMIFLLALSQRFVESGFNYCTKLWPKVSGGDEMTVSDV